LNSLKLYQPTKLNAHLFEKLIVILWYLGILKFFLTSNKTLNISYFINQIEEILDIKGITIAISCGAPGPLRKPVVKILGNNETIAYMKITNNEIVQNGLRNEKKILEFLQQNKIEGIKTPKVIYFGGLQGNLTLIMESLDFFQKSATIDEEIAFRTISKFSKLNLKYLLLKDSVFYKELKNIIGNIKNSYSRNLSISNLQLLIERSNEIKLPFHFSHGDFTRWNGFVSNEIICLFDFEYAKQEMPVGYDLFRFVIQESIHVHKNTLASIHDQFTKQIKDKDIFFKYYDTLIIDKENIYKTFYISYGLYIVNQLAIYSYYDPYNEHNMNTYRYLNLLFQNFLKVKVC
jgi:tRNA A-37 threonylcarbamoyl transferase component Bud32